MNDFRQTHNTPRLGLVHNAVTPWTYKAEMSSARLICPDLLPPAPRLGALEYALREGRVGSMGRMGYANRTSWRLGVGRCILLMENARESQPLPSAVTPESVYMPCPRWPLLGHSPACRLNLLLSWQGCCRQVHDPLSLHRRVVESASTCRQVDCITNATSLGIDQLPNLAVKKRLVRDQLKDGGLQLA